MKTLWAGEEMPRRDNQALRELVLPTGGTSLVFRLDHPLRVFADVDDQIGHRVDYAVVGGTRATFYVRDISHPLHSVGA